MNRILDRDSLKFNIADVRPLLSLNLCLILVEKYVLCTCDDTYDVLANKG